MTRMPAVVNGPRRENDTPLTVSSGVPASLRFPLQSASTRILCIILLRGQERQHRPNLPHLFSMRWPLRWPSHQSSTHHQPAKCASPQAARSPGMHLGHCRAERLVRARIASLCAGFDTAIAIDTSPPAALPVHAPERRFGYSRATTDSSRTMEREPPHGLPIRRDGIAARPPNEMPVGRQVPRCGGA